MFSPPSALGVMGNRKQVRNRYSKVPMGVIIRMAPLAFSVTPLSRVCLGTLRQDTAFLLSESHQ